MMNNDIVIEIPSDTSNNEQSNGENENNDENNAERTNSQGTNEADSTPSRKKRKRFEYSHFSNFLTFCK